MCGIPFDKLPFEFHPNGNGPYRITWRRTRDGGCTEYVQLNGQAGMMRPSEAYLIPGDWDMSDSIGNVFRITIIEQKFKMCTGYRPDNLRYLEAESIKHQDDSLG
jgi:hypothetical protein